MTRKKKFCCASSDQDKRGPLKPLTFDIKLDKDAWQKIKPIEVLYKDRVHEKLNTPWTDVIIEKIWNLHKIPCPFSFKKSQVSKSDGFPYFRFFGICRECSATIVGECPKEPNPNTGVTITINTYDTTQILHNKKRRLANSHRADAKQLLLGVKATYYKHVKANEVLNDSGTAPPFLHNTGIYRMARQEAKDEDIGLAAYPGDAITSSLLMMDSLSSIREISTVPLCVWYWTDGQLELWREAAALNTYISLDASGRFVKAVNVFGQNKTSHIFLYNIVIRLRQKIYSICQMLSESHDVNSIFSWLFAWLQSGAPTPKEVVVDCSSALLNAVCLAFNGCYFIDYLSKCLRFLIHKEDSLPQCLIKRDRAHLIKAVLRWKCFAGDNWVKKDFYVRCVAYSLEVEKLEQLKEVMKAIFIVCESQNADEHTECFRQKLWLDKKIANFDHSQYFDNSDSNGQSSSADNGNYVYFTEVQQSNEISKYVHEIYNSCLPLCSKDEDDLRKLNNHYLPKITQNLIQLYSQFPAWTNVMRSHYSSPNIVSTSTASECYYRIMRREYGMSSPVSLNRFLLRHLRVINGATKLGRGIIEQVKALANNGDQDYISARKQIGTIPTKDTLACSVYSQDSCETSRENTIQILEQNEGQKPTFLQDSQQLVTHYMQDTGWDITVSQFSCRGVVYHTIERHVLWSNEFRTLEPKAYIDGSVIDSFMIVNYKQNWKNISFFPTSQTSYMIGNFCNHRKPKSWPFYNIHFEFFGKIFIPYCYNSHWCLLVLDVDDQTITHFDPLIKTNSGDRAIAAFFKYLKKCNPAAKNSLCSIKWTVMPSTTKRPMQVDSYNCGIFIMYYMDCLAKTNLTESQDFDPNSYRKVIADQLISSSEPMHNICLCCLNDKKDECLSCKVCGRWIHMNCLLRYEKNDDRNEIFGDDICLLCVEK